MGFNLYPAWKFADVTAYTSVHAFRGLENKIVIVADAVLGAADFHGHLFYTGMNTAL